MAESALSLPLHGHVALVTGATGGIGAATCRQLAALGSSVAIHYNEDKSTAEDLCSELGQSIKIWRGQKYCIVQADMGDYNSVSRAWRVVETLPHFVSSSSRQ